LCDEEARPDRGSADEDEESVDEDFAGSSESDVAEELLEQTWIF
jgi:structure-specific recognition protein 1